jgi:hypothetical protein
LRSGSSDRIGDLRIVRAAFQHYAERGAFRGYSEAPGRGGKAEFKFLWVKDVTYRAAFDATRRTLTFINLLPDVPARSAMDGDLRRFIESRSDKSVVEHRRVDRRRLGVACVNRGGNVSIVFTLKGDAEYGVRKAVHLVHEIIMDFLNEGRFVQYMVDHFNLDPEMAS